MLRLEKRFRWAHLVDLPGVDIWEPLFLRHKGGLVLSVERTVC